MAKRHEEMAREWIDKSMAMDWIREQFPVLDEAIGPCDADVTSLAALLARVEREALEKAAVKADIEAGRRGALAVLGGPQRIAHFAGQTSAMHIANAIRALLEDGDA